MTKRPRPKKIDPAIDWTPERCKHCFTCVEICPAENLEFKDDEMVSLGKCTQCLLCMKYCPDFAIEVEARKKAAAKAAAGEGAAAGEAGGAGGGKP